MGFCVTMDKVRHPRKYSLFTQLLHGMKDEEVEDTS